MKRIILLIVLAGTIFQANAVPTSYVLHCMPGPGMRVELGLPGDALRVYYKPGKRGAGVEPVKPGTCTWSDRGLRSNEPRHFHHARIDDIRVHISSPAKVTRLSSGKAPYLANFFKNRLFQVQVYNSGRREFVPASMIVTKPGP